jgi:hypothetical protein
MAGSIVHMGIKGCAVGKFPAEFVDIKKSAKGVVANFLLKGDLSDEKSGQIYTFSGGNNVELTLEESQMSIEDFHSDEEMEEVEGDEQQEGLEFKANPDGTVELVKEEDKQLDPMAGVTGNVVDIKKPRAERVTKTEKAAKLSAESNHEASDDELPM